MERRPLKSRGTAWAKSLAKALANSNITPNMISVLSTLFAFLGGICLFYSFGQELKYLSLFFAGLFIQMRLLCNLMDGMVAIEYKKQTQSGDIFNDLPDRFSDAFIIIGLGYAVRDFHFAIELGYLASILAIMTAYIRVLGASLKTEHYFMGPMAKPQRMATITIAILINILSLLFLNKDFSQVLYIGLWVIFIGSLLTCYLRVKKIMQVLEGKA